jgi:hypothetical protein
MKFVHLPMSLVASIIRPEIFSIPIYCILGPTPLVLGAVLPLENALSMLHALLELANVVAAISQDLLAFSILHVFHPVANILLSVTVGVHSMPICFLSLESSFKGIPIRVIESSISFDFVIDPITDILCSIGECLRTRSLSDLCLGNHLAGIVGAIRQP